MEKDPIRKKWISNGDRHVFIWKKELGNNYFCLFVFLISARRVLMIILFLIVFSYGGRSIIYYWADKDWFSQHINQWLLWKLGEKTFPSFLFFIVNKAPEHFYFTHLRLSSTCFRKPLGVTLLGYISHNKNICNANIYKLT